MSSPNPSSVIFYSDKAIIAYISILMKFEPFKKLEYGLAVDFNYLRDRLVQLLLTHYRVILVDKDLLDGGHVVLVNLGTRVILVWSVCGMRRGGGGFSPPSAIAATFLPWGLVLGCTQIPSLCVRVELALILGVGHSDPGVGRCSLL